jgi:NADH-quinone oxidoreductase subunit N
LAGIPLTAGFIGKFWVLAAGVESNLWLLVILLVVSSTLGLYYYLRIVVAMVSQADDGVASNSPAVPFMGGLALTLLTVLLVWFGVYPAPLLRLIQNAVANL